MSHKENQIPFLYRRDILDNNQCLEIVKEFWKNKNLHKNVNTSNKVSTDLQCKFSEKNTRILLSKSINYISDALTIAINDYTKLYPQTKKLYLDWGLYDNFNLQFYQPHQGFGGYHCENLGKDYSDSNTRFLVWTIYLSNTLDGGTEFCRGIENPIGIKCGPTLKADDLINLCNKINPSNEKGKITLISRFGYENVSKHLPKLIRSIKKEGLNVIWSCDPCHGNTIKASTGFKTRPFNSVLSEVKNVFACHQSEGSYAGGLHIELTGQNVTECTGGAQKISDKDLSSRYHTHCDPRLNANQALELAFLISDEIKKNSLYSKNAIQAAS